MEDTKKKITEILENLMILPHEREETRQALMNLIIDERGWELTLALMNSEKSGIYATYYEKRKAELEASKEKE